MQKKILAVSSAGGHWIELLRLRRAFINCKVVYVTTNQEYKSMISGCDFYCVSDFNRKNFMRSFSIFLNMYKIIINEKPDIIVSTGAAPGLVVILLGRILCIKTIWVESVANVKHLSMSGKFASYISNHCYVQWPNLESVRAKYSGNVLG